MEIFLIRNCLKYYKDFSVLLVEIFYLIRIIIYLYPIYVILLFISNMKQMQNYTYQVCSFWVYNSLECFLIKANNSNQQYTPSPLPAGSNAHVRDKTMNQVCQEYYWKSHKWFQVVVYFRNSL